MPSLLQHTYDDETQRNHTVTRISARSSQNRESDTKAWADHSLREIKRNELQSN